MNESTHAPATEAQPTGADPSAGPRGDLSARFVLLGVGGLGCPALMGLWAAGVRRFLLVDFDRVDASNLQRQVLFDAGDVGALKVDAAARWLAARQPRAAAKALQVERRAAPLTVDQVPAFVDALEPDDVVLECSDDTPLKFAVNDACRAAAVPLVIGGVVQWEGRAMAVQGPGPCYRCFFTAPPPAAGVARCADAGVLGAAAGMVGQLMAALAVHAASAKKAAPAGDLSGRLHVLDARDLRPRVLAPPRRRDCPACARSPLFDRDESPALAAHA